jgi:hypothetical protein
MQHVNAGQFVAMVTHNHTVHLKLREFLYAYRDIIHIWFYIKIYILIELFLPNDDYNTIDV